MTSLEEAVMWDWGIILTWIFNWVVIVIFLIAFFILIIWAVTKLIRTGKSVGGNALDIAKERYARGEINKEEFEQIKKDIQ
jgi:putative membrane protein